MRNIKVYKFDELSKEAQEKAIEGLRYSDSIEYGWYDDNEKSLKEFENTFPIKIKNWSYGGNRGDGISFEMDCEDNISELSGFRLAKYIWNNYKWRIYKGKYYSSRLIPTGRTTPPMVNYKFRYSKCTLQAGANFTGYIGDMYLLDTIFDFLDKPYEITFRELMKEALEQWIEECTADVESTYEDEYIKDHIIANDYEFFKSGQHTAGISL